jgi:hypothetical protein
MPLVPIFWVLGGLGVLTIGAVDVHYMTQDSKRLMVLGAAGIGAYYLLRSK